MTEAMHDFHRQYAAPQLTIEVDDLERRREEAEGQALAAPGEPFAIRGCLLTPDRQVADGWVVVHDGKIVEVCGSDPGIKLTLETSGVVLPGLIDLHSHPEY